jgi:hypothetical protein
VMRETKSTHTEKATSTMITTSQVFRLRMIRSIHSQKYQPLAGAAPLYYRTIGLGIDERGSGVKDLASRAFAEEAEGSVLDLGDGERVSRYDQVSVLAGVLQPPELFLEVRQSPVQAAARRADWKGGIQKY